MHVIVMPSSQGWYETPDSPFREALQAVTGVEPPWELAGVYCYNDIADADVQEEVHNWASMNCRPSWATGLSMIEAAELIVEQAVENVNILKPQVEA